jgi:nicotinate-nucleotide adenylyltransferase
MPEGVTPVTTRRIDVSSSEIRARMRAGSSIKGFVAESVESFITAAKLYASPAAA